MPATKQCAPNWQLVLAALTVFFLCTGAMWGMVGVHSEHPHAGSVSRAEFDMRGTYLDERLDRIERKLDQVVEVTGK